MNHLLQDVGNLIGRWLGHRNGARHSYLTGAED